MEPSIISWWNDVTESPTPGIIVLVAYDDGVTSCTLEAQWCEGQWWGYETGKVIPTEYVKGWRYDK